MFKNIMLEIEKELSGVRALEYTKNIWNFDRWFTFPKILEGAGYCVDVMKSIGLSSVELIEQPADGETLFGNWMSPLAWDAGEATLEIVEPREFAQVLANRQEAPCSLIFWSAPTRSGEPISSPTRSSEPISSPTRSSEPMCSPTRSSEPVCSPVEAEVLLLEEGTPAEVEQLNVTGKMLFTERHPRDIKAIAAKKGAAGIISAYSKYPDEMPDVTCWINSWSDLSGGWMLTKRDSHLLGFSITPRKGKILKEIISSERSSVIVRAKIDSRFYEGILPGATGVIKGTTLEHEEVMVLGHNGEQGANDNASGCGAMLEIANCLNALIEDGKLPRPKRSIRILMCAECYGTLAYIQEHRERMKNTVACLNLDTVGGRPSSIGAKFQFVPNPHSNMAYTDALVENILASTFEKNPSFEYQIQKQFSMIDNLMTDAYVGVPAHSFYEIGKYWHCSADTPEILDEETIKSASLFAATYLYFIANAGYEEARWLAKATAEKGKERIIEFTQEQVSRADRTEPDETLSEMQAEAEEHVNYLLERQIEAMNSVKRLLSENEIEQISGLLNELSSQLREMADDELRKLSEHFGFPVGEKRWRPLTENEKKASMMIPKRKFVGTITYDDLPDELRLQKSSPRWWGELGCSLYWCDGKRNLLDIMDLVKHELGRKVDLLKEFEFLAEHGYIRLTICKE